MAKEIKTKKEGEKAVAPEVKVEKKASANKKKISSGILYVESTFNNTKVSLTDTAGNVIVVIKRISWF